MFRDLLGRALGHEQPARRAGFRPEIDHVIRALDDFEVVLDHEEAVAILHQPGEDLHEHRDVVKVQAGRRLIENEQGAVFVALRQALDELEPLRLAAGKHVERLAEREIAEAHFLEHAQRLDNAGDLRGVAASEVPSRSEKNAMAPVTVKFEHAVDRFLSK